MKKIISVLLCLALALTMLAGCSGSKEAPAEAAQTEKQEAKPAENKAEAKAEDKTEAAAEPLCTPIGTFPIIPEGQECTLKIAITQSPLTEDYETNELTQWLEEQTGIKLDFVYLSADPNECKTQVALMLSSGEELPDLFMDLAGVDLTAVNEYGEDGYFIDLKPYFDNVSTIWKERFSKLEPSVQAYVLSTGTDPNNGAIYGFPKIEIWDACDNCVTTTTINKEWLDKLGKPMPETIDEVAEVLAAFVNDDPNGNGEKDEIGAAGWPREYRSNVLQYFINAYVYCNDMYFFNATDGKIWQPYTTDEYRQAMIKMNQMYKDGLIAPLTFSISDWSEITSLYTPSDNVAKLGVNGCHPILCTETDNEILYQYAALPPLKAETSLGGYAAMNAPDLNFETFITCDCKNPEAAFRMLDLLSSEEGSIRMLKGTPGRDWNYASEGMTGISGEPAVIDVVVPDVFSTQNNINWHTLTATTASGMIESYKDDGSWPSFRGKLCDDINSAYKAAPKPAEVIYSLSFNEEETEVVSEVKTVLVDYIQEARALFITGVKDPSNDADWQEYLDACEGQGMSRYVEAAQAAYDRQN